MSHEDEKIPKATVRKLVQRIKSDLPKGWTCEYEAENQWLEFRRVEPTLMSAHEGINGPAEKLPLKNGHPWFAFHIVSFVSPVGFGERHAELSGRFSAIQSEFENRFVGLRTFVPKTEIEKLRAAEYDRLVRAFMSLPDYYYQDISLHYFYNPTDFWDPGTVESSWIGNRVIDEKVQAECRRVFDIVTGPLTKYDYPRRKN